MEQRGKKEKKKSVSAARNAFNHVFYERQLNKDIKESHVHSASPSVLTPAAIIDLTFLILSVNVTNGPIK